MSEDQAKQRFMLLNLVRLSGLILVMVGLANVMGKLAPDLAPWFGRVLLVMGVADYYFAPMVLKRAWRNGDQ